MTLVSTFPIRLCMYLCTHVLAHTHTRTRLTSWQPIHDERTKEKIKCRDGLAQFYIVLCMLTCSNKEELKNPLYELRTWMIGKRSESSCRELRSQCLVGNPLRSDSDFERIFIWTFELAHWQQSSNVVRYDLMLRRTCDFKSVVFS